MTDTKELDAGRALDRIFSIVRDEAMGNPRFAARLAEAAGYNVVFRGAEALAVLDPVQVAMKGQEEFRQTFLSFKPAELKKLVTEFNLGTKQDLQGLTRAPQIVDLMWAGALAKLHDRGGR